MTKVEYYHTWMEELAERNYGELLHRVIPTHENPYGKWDTDNQVLVSIDEHFYIHKLMYEIEPNISTAWAWFGSWSYVAALSTISQSDYDEMIAAFSKECKEHWKTIETTQETRDKMSASALKFYANGGANAFKDMQHSRETKKLLSEMKHELYRTNPNVCRRISETLTGREGHKHTDKHKNYMSGIHTGEGNPMHGTLPWDNPASQEPHTQKAWTMLIQLYSFYNANKHKTRGWGYRAAAKHLGWRGSAKPLLNPMRWVINNGDPLEDSNWVDYYSTYLETKNGLDTNRQETT